ncbi:YitT family protein [Isoptericola jiangsuensis]|uniref:YitT family protein n=1 Tax=Isoptericola jiangsuensis TaxID=548579 RepID=UPI003AAC5477
MTAPRPADPADQSSGVKHSLAEDTLGILTGTFVISLGLYLLKSVSAVTGGTAGLSLLVSYVAPVPFPLLFALVNLPFFLLAIRMKGWDFTIRTGVSIALVSGFSVLHPAMLGDLDVIPVYGVVAGNVLAGVGLLIVFRHRASLGGFNIVALIAQERFGWRAGYVQMVLDSFVVLSAFVVVAPATVLLSVLGAVLLNMILAMNHRPGRYTGY